MILSMTKNLWEVVVGILAFHYRENIVFIFMLSEMVNFFESIYGLTRHYGCSADIFAFFHKLYTSHMYTECRTPTKHANLLSRRQICSSNFSGMIDPWSGCSEVQSNDEREMTVMASGPPMQHGAQLVVDITLVRPLQQSALSVRRRRVSTGPII